MDELSLKHSVLRACDEVGFPEGKKFASGHRSFTDGCSSTDRLSEAACELGQECLYILSNLPKNSPAYKQMKSIMGEVMQCWEDCGSDESSRKEDAMLERIKTLRGKITPIKTAMMNTNANPHAVCIKEMEEMIAGMEYLYAQYQKNPDEYPGYEVLGTMIPQAKAALASLKNVSVYSTAAANELAKTMQGFVRNAREYLVKNVQRLEPQLFDQMKQTADKWAQETVNARQKPLAEKAMIKELTDDEVDFLLGFVEQEKDIVAFIAKAEQDYTGYEKRLNKMKDELAAIKAKKQEIKTMYKNGRISKEEALREIENLTEREEACEEDIEEFEYSNENIVEQYKFAQKISRMYFITMRGFSYQEKAVCFQEGQVGINLKECMEGFRNSLTGDGYEAIEKANDTLDAIIEKVSANAERLREIRRRRDAEREARKNAERAKREQREQQRNGSTPQKTEKRTKAESFLDDEEEETEGGVEVTEDPLQETSTNSPQRTQTQASSSGDDYEDIFGEKTERQRN